VRSSAKDDLKGLGVEACIHAFGLQKGLIEAASSGQPVSYMSSKIASRFNWIASGGAWFYQDNHGERVGWNYGEENLKNRSKIEGVTEVKEATNGNPWMVFRFRNYGDLLGVHIHTNAQMKAVTSAPAPFSDSSTIGYAADTSNIYIRKHSITENCESIKLIAHELTHVLQYRSVGNHQRDLCGQYVSSGYKDAPWEKEANYFEDAVKLDCYLKPSSYGL